MAENAVFFVFNPKADKPRQIHASLAEAEEEAIRISSLAPDIEIYVLRVISSFTHLSKPYIRKQYSKK